MISLKENRIQQIDEDSFDAYPNLKQINLNENQIQEIEKDTFKNLTKLETIQLSMNKILIIEANIFSSLKSLKKIDLSSNQIYSIRKDLFKDLVTLEEIYLNDNNLSFIDKEMFNGLLSLTKIDLGENQIQNITKTTFHNLLNLKEISLNNNQLKEINKATFHGLFNLQKINLAFNQLTQIDRLTFKELRNLEEIKINDNQLQSIPNALFKDNKSLLEINLSNNVITKVFVSDMFSLNKNSTINLRNNMEFYDFPFIFNSMFQIVKKEIVINEMQSYFDEFRGEIMGKNFVVRQFNCENFLISFYLNKAVFKTEVLFGPNRKSSFAYKLDQLKTFKYTLLDFMLSYRMIDEAFIVYFKEYFVNLLKENKLAQNLEFKLKSPQSVEILCERNDLLLFETFFQIEIDDNNQRETDGYNQWIVKHKDFYLNINFIKCFEIVFGNNNEKLAIHLFKLLAYVIKKFDVPKMGIQKFSERSFFVMDEYKNISEFNGKFLRKFLTQIFEIKWYDLINTILDLAYNYTENCLNIHFIYLNDDYLENETQKSIQLNSALLSQRPQTWRKSIKDEPLEEVVIVDTPIKTENAPKDESIKSPNKPKLLELIEGEILASKDQQTDKPKNNKNDKIQNNILYLINSSQNSTFLSHETTQKLLNAKWHYVPRFIYYFNLILYLLFIIFYTIQALGYIQDDFYNYGLVFHSSIICTIILAYFIFLEFTLIRDMDGFNLAHFISLKHIIELINFILLLVVMYLSNTDFKSGIMSVNCIVTYAIFITRLDKFYGIGIFVNVFGKIIRTALGVIVIILIMLIGYALSITVRSRYFQYLKLLNQTQLEPLSINGLSYDINEVVNFEYSFENNIVTMITYMCGQIVSGGMGIDEMNWTTLPMFVIYGSFCFVMTMLFYNVFVGIATYEIRIILQNSKISIASSKIDYIFKLEYRFHGLKAYKWMEIMLKWFEEIFFILKEKFYLKIVSSLINGKKKEKKILQKSMEENLIEKVSIINDSNERLLIELKQISSLMQKKFDFVDQRLEKMEKQNKNKNSKANLDSLSDSPSNSATTRRASNRSRLQSLKQNSFDKSLDGEE